MTAQAGAPPGNGAGAHGEAGAGEVEQQLGGGSRTTSIVPHRADRQPEPRWCRFTDTWCSCTVAGLESATMTVCARHYLEDEAVAS